MRICDYSIACILIYCSIEEHVTEAGQIWEYYAGDVASVLGMVNTVFHGIMFMAISEILPPVVQVFLHDAIDILYAILSTWNSIIISYTVQSTNRQYVQCENCSVRCWVVFFVPRHIFCYWI